MKTLWTMISTLAVANLLAILVFAGWLYGTDRINLARTEQIRVMLSQTVTAETAAAADAAAKVVVAAEETKKAEKAALPPESAAEALERQRADDDAREQTRVRRQRELEDLARQLIRDRDTLDEERTKFLAEKTSFDSVRVAANTRARDAQFQQALATLEAQKPKDAYTVMRAMLDAKADEDVITYLTAMDEGKRAKILTEFIKTDDKLAAGLLQQLRQHGVAAPDGVVPPRAASQTP